MLKYLKSTIMLGLALMLAGCSGDSREVPAPAAVRDGDINLCISVSTHDAQQFSTTDIESVPNDTTYFEAPAYIYEQINTLRVIITFPDGTVEFNDYINFAQATTTIVKDRVYKTKIPGKRKIYLIANEASVPDASSNFRVFPGSKIGNITDMILSAANAGEPLIDNTGSVKKYLPMTEQFDVDIKTPPVDYEGDYWQYANLFITRAASKFSFSIETPKPSADQIKVKRAVINAIGDREYLFPTGTTYEPYKYVDDRAIPDAMRGRLITAYKVPDGSVNSSLTFDFGDRFTFDSKTTAPIKYAPEIYFPETALNGKYTATFTVEYADGSTADFTAELPNLPSLPRNTHVVIFVSFDPVKLKANVDVVPYYGLELDPLFGFDDLLDKPMPEPDPDPDPDIDV